MLGVLGDINIDLFSELDRYPDLDDEVEIRKIKEISGGTGANTAVAISRLGGKVILFGSIGNDFYGRKLFNILKREDIKLDILFTTEDQTGICFAAVDKIGNRRLFSYRGANKYFNITSKTLEKMNSCSIVHVCGGTPKIWETLLKHKERFKFSFDPGSMACSKWTKEVKEAIRRSDYLFLNKNEYNILEISKNQLSTITFIKSGDKGGTVIKNGETFFQWKPRKAKQVDSTAAGDVFNGAVLIKLDEKKSIKKAVKFGSLAASISVERIGAQSSIPTLSEVIQLSEKGGTHYGRE